MSRAQQQQGASGQQAAALALQAAGVEMVEEIGTPIIRKPSPIKGAFFIVYGEKVSGDHRGVLPGGRSVLVETKTVHGDRLNFSELREHQPGRLSRHAEIGGLSLLVWVSDWGALVLRWPVPGFSKGKSLRYDRARDLAVESVL